jgi:hypothetical protein
VFRRTGQCSYCSEQPPLRRPALSLSKARDSGGTLRLPSGVVSDTPRRVLTKSRMRSGGGWRRPQPPPRKSCVLSPVTPMAPTPPDSCANTDPPCGLTPLAPVTPPPPPTPPTPRDGVLVVEQVVVAPAARVQGDQGAGGVADEPAGRTCVGLPGQAQGAGGVAGGSGGEPLDLDFQHGQDPSDPPKRAVDLKCQKSQPSYLISSLSCRPERDQGTRREPARRASPSLRVQPGSLHHQHRHSPAGCR